MSALVDSCSRFDKHEPHWLVQPPEGGVGGVRCEGNPASFPPEMVAALDLLKPKPRMSSYLSPQQMFLLDLACKPLAEAFRFPPYLVGSVMERQDYRDVDVRLILEDNLYDRIIATPEIRTLLSIAFSAYLSVATGLPIDFGIQRMTQANEQHDKPRNPLGLRHLANWIGDAPRTTAEQPDDTHDTQEDR